MATKGESVEEFTTSNNKELSKEKCDYSSSDKNTDNSVNSEPVKICDKDLNFSKGNNADNGSVFGTSDNPSASRKRGENNGAFVGGKKASIAVSDVDGRAFDILLK